MAPAIAHLVIATSALDVVVGLVLIAFFVGVIFWLLRVAWRAVRGARETHPTIEPPTTPEPVVEEVNRAGLALAVVGALLMTIAAFLPRVESGTFLRVEKNTLIQGGDGWILLVIAVGVVADVYRVNQRQRKTPAVLVAGLIAIGLAVYEGTGSRLELTSANPNPITGAGINEKANPGVGIYAAGVGGLITAVGGAWLLGLGVGAGGQLAPGRRLKTCPDCAESVLADARVCKHCGYRFEPSDAPVGGAN